MSEPASVSIVNGEIVIRLRVPDARGPEAPADRLVPLNRKGCKAEGLELAGLRAKVDAGELPVVDIGRIRYVRLSDILALARPVAKVAARAGADAELAQGVVSVRRRKPRAA